MGTNLQDNYGRIASYLRIGVTDRCNLRCRYCMPEEGIDFAHRDDILSYEQLLRLASIFQSFGVDKIRLTGGEPFVRKDFTLLLQKLTTIFPAVHITTNATLLEDHIPALKEMGISGLNISIDSLDRERFFMITRRDSFDIVMKNILSCNDAGIPIKLNIVVMKGVNDMEILDFIRFGMKHKIEVRFIEAMPFNEDDGNKSVYISTTAIEEIINTTFLISKRTTEKGSSANRYTTDTDYVFGIIPAYSRSLCGSCNRIRLTPKGEFLTCLYAQTGTNLLDMLKANATDREISDAILNSVSHKKKDGFEEEALLKSDVFRSMTTIGG